MDPHQVPSPCFVVDLGKLRHNLETIDAVQQASGAKIILALKGFAMFSTFPLIREYLVGTTASSVNEALLGHHEFGGEVHVYAPAYTDEDIRELIPLAHHISFNSISQFHRHRKAVQDSGRDIACGLRINPEYSEVEVPLYDPCYKHSRLGVTLDQLQGADIEGITGLHFHTMCEQNSDVLERTLEVVEKKFGRYIDRMQWINFGGGHHITRSDYDKERLIRIIRQFRERHPIQVYMEPGEAIALNTGILVATVEDLFHNGTDIAILDTSATAHMPDVLEMPYRPEITGGDQPGVKAHSYRLGGLTCLAGDVIGDYSFDQALKIGDKLVFHDMAHYTMVKTTQFNGVRHPSIATYDPDSGKIEIVRRFGYEDYRSRLS